MGPQWHRHKGQSPAGACSEQVLWLFVERVELEQPGLGSPRELGCARDVPASLMAGTGSCAPTQTAGRLRLQSRIQHSIKLTHPKRKHMDFMLLSRTLNWVRCSFIHQCSTNTPFTLMQKTQIISETAVKNISFDWTLLVLSPSILCACMAWSPSGREFPPSSAPSTQLWCVPAHCHSKRVRRRRKCNLDRYVLYLQLSPNTGTATTSPFVQRQQT